jgi:threonine/homoserine/homoserine lactone efflux protein
MSRTEFLFAVGGLLLTPGPTNALLALAGSMAGLRRALALIPVETAGYLLVVVPLALFGGTLFGRFPVLGEVVKLAAAAWVMFLAVRLWRPGTQEGESSPVTPERLFVTTLLNPKGLVFGLVLLPAAGAAQFGERLALFSVLLVLSAAIWVSGGSLLGRAGAASRFPAVLRAAAGGWLAILSVGLAVRTLAL